jgi:hypothetical protein
MEKVEVSGMQYRPFGFLGFFSWKDFFMFLGKKEKDLSDRL